MAVGGWSVRCLDTPSSTSPLGTHIRVDTLTGWCIRQAILFLCVSVFFPYPSASCTLPNRCGQQRPQHVLSLFQLMMSDSKNAAMSLSNDDKNNGDQLPNDPMTLDLPPASPTAAAVEFAKLVGRLKTTPRTGWVRRGVPKYESVADHSWRVATLSLLLLRDDVDVTKCMALGLLHDLAECIMGDFCPQDHVSKQDKMRMEQKAMSQIGAVLERATATEDATTESNGNGRSVSMLMDLFQEYEARESKEARAVKDLDLLDMILQADEYEERFEDMDLSEFFHGTPPSRFQTPALQRIAEEVHAQRTNRRHKSMPDTIEKQSLSKNDAAFVDEYSKASTLSSDDVEKVVQALRTWEVNAR